MGRKKRKSAVSRERQVEGVGEGFKLGQAAI
jgi:hypothetical protein